MNNKEIVNYSIIALTILVIVSLAIGLKTTATLNTIQEEVNQISESINGIEKQVNEINNKTILLGETVYNYTSNLRGFQNSFSTIVSELVKQIRESQFPLQIQDAMNRMVVIPSPPQKIVSIAPSITEVLFAINASDLIIGVDDYSNYPPVINDLVEEGKIQRVGGFAEISIEKVLSLKPDIVIGTTGVQFKTLYKLSQMGLTTLSVKTDSISDVFADVLLLGKITGHTQEAVELVNNLKNNITSLYLKIQQETNSTTSIVYIVWINPIYAAGGESWFNDIIELSGGENILENTTEEWPVISWEQIVESNPEVILVSEYAGGYTNATQLISWLKQQPGGDQLQAVNTGHVYMLHGELNDIAARPGPRIYILQETLSLILHPELYNQTNIPNDLTIQYVLNTTQTMTQQ